MRDSLRLCLSGSAFIYVMPRELVEVAYANRINSRPRKFDDRQNRLMVEFTREVMRVQRQLKIPAMECYHSGSWDAKLLCDAVQAEGPIECWSVHAPYGRYIDPSSPEKEAREGAAQECCDAITIATRLGAKVLVVHPGTNTKYAVPKATRLKFAAETIAGIADFAAARGVTLAVEPLPKQEPGNSLEEVVQILEMMGKPNVGINFDVNHLFPAAAIPRLIRQAGARIRSVHISDQDDEERHWLPFRGKLDWAKVLAALIATGYTGPLVYETHIKDARTCEGVARIVVENYQRLIQLIPGANARGVKA